MLLAAGWALLGPGPGFEPLLAGTKLGACTVSDKAGAATSSFLELLPLSLRWCIAPWPISLAFWVTHNPPQTMRSYTTLLS